MPAKTEKNLAYAFAAESKASARNETFALKAAMEGYPQIARLFRAVSDAESVHAQPSRHSERDNGFVHMIPEDFGLRDGAAGHLDTQHVISQVVSRSWRLLAGVVELGLAPGKRAGIVPQFRGLAGRLGR